MRKGSTDHLTIDIGSESTRLINSAETDEDKGLHFRICLLFLVVLRPGKLISFIFSCPLPGHVFTSLNASGLIPRQGKSIADRIDGIW